MWTTSENGLMFGVHSLKVLISLFALQFYDWTREPATWTLTVLKLAEDKGATTVAWQSSTSLYIFGAYRNFKFFLLVQSTLFVINCLLVMIWRSSSWRRRGNTNHRVISYICNKGNPSLLNLRFGNQRSLQELEFLHGSTVKSTLVTSSSLRW